MRALWSLTAALPALLFASGCSSISGTSAVTAPLTQVQGPAFTGAVHGGQQPISGAHVYLYAVNTTGYGGNGISASSSNASISLLTSATGNPVDGNGNYYVTTALDGSFSITGDYTCPSIASPVYLYAAGGDPGFGPNSGAVLLAGLGTCSANGTLSSSLYAVVNEVSTIATAYSLAGFATDPTHISGSSTTKGQSGIKNASNTISTLEVLNSGVARTTLPSGSGSVPQSEIDTLANILAACVNSTGPTSTACTTLFSNAKNGSTAPTDTASAAINIAHNPGSNLSNLFGLQAATSPFQPMLSSTPNDFAIAIKNTSGGLTAPYGVAVGGGGEVWVANNGGASISEFDNLAAPMSGSPITGGGLTNPYFIAADTNNDVWVTNPSGNLGYFHGTGVPFFSTGFGLVSGAAGLALDSSVNAWVANSSTSGTPSNSISEFTAIATEVSPAAGYTGGGLNGPQGVAIDISGNVWATNPASSTISELSSTGAVKTGSPFSGGGLLQPAAAAVDASGNIWTGNIAGNSLSEFSSSGTAISGSSGYTGGGLNVPFMIAIDGNGNIWAANNGASNNGNSISEFNSSGVPITGATGYQGGLSGAWGIAVDESGNVWVSSAGNNSITKFVGLAVPVVTPIEANLEGPYAAHAVNKP